MTEQQPDRLGKVQADLVHLSSLLSNLASDVYALSRDLPQQVRPVDPAPRPLAPRQGAPTYPAAQAPAPAMPQVATRPPAQPQPQPINQTPARPAAAVPYSAPYPAAPAASAPMAPPPAAPGRVQVQGPRPVAPMPPTPPFVPTGAYPRPVPPPTGAPRRKVTIAEVFSIVGSAITLLGVAFVLLLPADGFLGQIPRAGIGIGLAIVVVIAALVQHAKEPSNIGSQALLGTGVASAFLSILALSSIFTNGVGQPLLTPWIGITLGGLVSLGGVAVARWWHSQWLAVLAVLGSLVLAPYLGGQSALTPMIFMLVMTLVTSAFQHKVDWVVLLIARVLPTVIYFSAVIVLGHVWMLVDPLYSLGLSFVLAAGGLGIAVQHQRGSQTMRAAGVGAMVLMVMPMILALWQPDRYLAGSLAVGIGLVFAVAGLIPQIFVRDVRVAAAPLGATMILLGIARLLDGQYFGYVLFAMAAAYFGIYVVNRFLPIFVIASVASVLGIVDWMPSIVGVFAPLSSQGLERVFASLLGLLATLMAMKAVKVLQPRSGVALFYVTWIFAAGFGSVAVIIGGSVIGENIGQQYAGFQTAHAVVTVAWLLISVLLLRLGLRSERYGRASVRLAIAFAAAAVLKLFLFDLSTLPDLVRALAFLAVGLLMLVIGTWYHKQLEKARASAPNPQVPGMPGQAAGGAMGAPPAPAASGAPVNPASMQRVDGPPPPPPVS